MRIAARQPGAVPMRLSEDREGSVARDPSVIWKQYPPLTFAGAVLGHAHVASRTPLILSIRLPPMAVKLLQTIPEITESDDEA